MKKHLIDLTQPHRTIILIMIIVQLGLFAYANSLLTHYHTLKIPFFSQPSMLDQDSQQ